MIAAVIVLYHPEPAALEQLLSSLASQVDVVIAVDNTPSPATNLPAMFQGGGSQVVYIQLKCNRGIAEAQNIGITRSVEMGCSHVLLLDQDSVLTSGFVHKLLNAQRKLIKAGVRVAAVGPQFVDAKTGIPSFAVRYGFFSVRKIRLDAYSTEPVESDILIASGSLIQIDTIRSVGMMEGDLFIDFVDTEWALRARKLGYKCYCVPDAVMQHNLGESAATVFGKSVYLHGDSRKYYRLRNAVHLLKSPRVTGRWKTYTLCWIPYYAVLHICLSDDKVRNTRLFLRALWDGFVGKLGPCDAELSAR